MSSSDVGLMQQPSFWLCLWDGHQHRLEPSEAPNRQAATREGMEFYSDTLAAVFSKELTLTKAEMLDLAPVLPPPGSAMWRMD